MKFKYNGKIIETPNLEKKLKRMKLTLADVEIIKENSDSIEHIKQKVTVSKPTANSDNTPSIVYFWNPNNNNTIMGTVDTSFGNLIWNEETKTGVRGFNPNDWRLLRGKPIFPITIGIDGYPICE